MQTSTTQSGTDPMSTFANAGATGGPMLPPGDFLQNIIQMATNAALQGQSGRQGMLDIFIFIYFNHCVKMSHFY